MFDWPLSKKMKIDLLEFKERINNGLFDDTEQITELKLTKRNEQVLIFYPKIFEDSLQIKLYNGSHVNMINLSFRDNKMIIADIKVLGKENTSKGYGTILIEQALKIAEDRRVKVVEGRLFTTDHDNSVRQMNFYNKYGFEVRESSIRLELK